MRIALIAVLGFCAVFVWSLIVAPGNDGPPLNATRFCGTWRPVGDHPRRHVAFANRMSCARAVSLAVGYNRTRTCPKSNPNATGSSCQARIAGLKCFAKGAAGRRLVWVGCETPTGHPPRAVFSVDRV